ncbi:B-cell receptor CD22 isoform X2 [Oryctolagus cuniculus]|uniref:B-cell receptor CD22 isoform X2 n=1 Tax=Oryctolagus cuniculus TaxID=9986 RepID=UPI0022319EBF|nr:B-cell receptor CD22 isoform X2 [Oryctolagus cuniculus]
MQPRSPWLVLLVCVASCNPTDWRFEHPKTLYAWEGACVWIPCSYTIPKFNSELGNFTLYHNPEYDNVTKSYRGTVLYNHTQTEELQVRQGRVHFLGDKRRNCTVSIRPVSVTDSGQLGFRMTSGTDKWMEKMSLNVSEKPLSPHIQPPPELRESHQVTLTCSLNFSCPEDPMELRWSLEGTVTSSTILSTASVLTQSWLTFEPQWTHHGQNLSCQLWNSTARQALSEKTVQLDVKHPPKEVTTVIQNPTPIREGDSVTLSCIYNSSNPSVFRYEWKPLGSWKEPSPGVLNIHNVAWNAEPVACAACNTWCSWAPSVNLDVQYAPRGVKISPSVQSEVPAGSRFTLRCDFSGSRPTGVHFSWRKNGSPLQAGQELSFDSITPEDAGNYSCSVNNSVGRRSSEPWTLRVLYAPRRLQVSMVPGDTVMEGSKVALTCESDANPPVSQYAWFDWNNQNLQHWDKTLTLEPTTVEHSGAYRCRGSNRLGMGESPPSTLTVYYSPETIGRRAAVGIGSCLALLVLAIWVVKLRQNWKRIRSQQGLQENFSGQSFFVRNPKVRRAPLSNGPHSLGCYNPVMEHSISYATLRFPEMDTPSTGDAGTAEVQRPPLSSEDTVTYSVVQKRRVADYENVTPDFPEDEGIHYSELVQFGTGVRPQAQEEVEYVTLKQ